MDDLRYREVVFKNYDPNRKEIVGETIIRLIDIKSIRKEYFEHEGGKLYPLTNPISEENFLREDVLEFFIVETIDGRTLNSSWTDQQGRTFLEAYWQALKT